jgi:hypothetical protein
VLILSKLEQLREAYGSLNDVMRNLASITACLRKQDLKMAEHHLRAPDWHLGQANQRIAAVGQVKSPGLSHENEMHVTRAGGWYGKAEPNRQKSEI